MILIGLNGRKQAGKDTAAAYLANIYGFRTIKFAALLYESMSALFDVPIEVLDALKDDPRASVRFDASGWRRSFSVREALQRYGTEAHRDVFGADFWIEAMYRGGLDEGRRYVISDARFPNELRSVRARGGHNVRLERGAAESDHHASEAPPPPELLHFTLDNNRDLPWLYEQLDGVCAVLGIPAVHCRECGHNLDEYWQRQTVCHDCYWTVYDYPPE